MADDKISLPPLPGSDTESLSKDEYHPFYQRKTSEVWDGEIVRENLKEFKECKHIFKSDNNDAYCDICHVRYENFMVQENCTIKEGHLFYKGKQVVF